MQKDLNYQFSTRRSAEEKNCPWEITKYFQT